MADNKTIAAAATSGLTRPKKKSPMSTFLLFASFAVVMIIMFNEPLRVALGTIVGYAFDPTIGFGHAYPILTILLASVILVVATTAIRHFLVDWVNMARVQEAMRSFQKEFAAARKENNTYKMKKLTDAQPQVMSLQADMSTEQMKPMAFTMLLVIPIFAWLYAFVAAAAVLGNHVARVPWDAAWDLTINTAPPDNHWYLLGFLPRWIVLYSLFGIPFGQIAQRALKLWEYRHHDLDADGKTPAQGA
ncbi:MAG: EMC3/TMCO1 family protein [Candidatus Thermoplasmatota archaeon]